MLFCQFVHGLFLQFLPFWASGLGQAGTQLYKPCACSETSNEAYTLLLTPIMLLQLSATVTKITKQRKPAPALSETSC